MTVNFCIGLDLGSDTLKIAYAYEAGGAERSGKISGGNTSMTALPSVAYFDAENGVWLFGEEVSRAADESFITVVKIKKLLSLLAGVESAAVFTDNKRYYFEGNEFPNFYFPRRKAATRAFGELVKNEMTFTAEGFTPQKVCQMYFEYVSALVRKRLMELTKKLGGEGYGMCYSVVYPPHVGGEFVGELTRLVTYAFGKAPQNALSMTKALSVFAIHGGMLQKGESALIFNMGEEEISVVKANLLKSGLSVDGVDGHNAPLQLGGNDIDDAVAEYLEAGMYRRETMGSPRSGEEGHIFEHGLQSKQYLFVKDIKTAKIILGMVKKNFFTSGVPVCVSRDLYIQKKITREEFLKCTGISTGGGVAGKIAEYIEAEVKRPVNKDVKKIFLSGGLVETYGLVDFLAKKIEPSGVRVCTFENKNAEAGGLENDGFNIMPHEDALYSPALGCALAVLKNYTVKTVIALSYGLRLFTNDSYCRPFFAILVERGTPLKDSGNKFLRKNITTGGNCEASDDMNIISAPVTEAEIQAKKHAGKVNYFNVADGSVRLYLPTNNAAEMRRLRDAIGLKVIESGSKSGVIWNYYKGKRVFLRTGVSIAIGVDIDGDGAARAYVTNCDERDGVIGIEYMRQNYLGNWQRGTAAYVKAKDIEFKFLLDDFVVQGKD